MRSAADMTRWSLSILTGLGTAKHQNNCLIEVDRIGRMMQWRLVAVLLVEVTFVEKNR